MVHWFVLNIAPNAQKFLVCWLEFLCVETYQFVHFKPRRKRSSLRVSTFPGYLFVRLNLAENDWRMLHTIPGVIGFLGDDREHPMPLPEGELDELKRFHWFVFESEKNTSVTTFQPGDSLIIMRGPFASYEATCLIEKDKKVSVLVDIFGRSTQATIDCCDVKQKIIDDKIKNSVNNMWEEIL